MSTDTKVKELVINKLTKDQYDAAVQAGTISETELYMITDTTYPTTDDIETLDATLVHKAGTETITGDKTFSGAVALGSSATATTQSQGDNSTAVATTAYVDTGLSGKLSTTSTPNIVYGTNENGAQVGYDINGFGKVDDVKVNGVSVVTNKIAELGTMASESASNYSYTNAFANIAFSGEYSDLVNAPTLATVATTGEYTDLLNTPTISTVGSTGEYSDLINAPVLANIATSGDYADLTNTPAFANIALSGEYSDLVNAPVLATVATTGEYSDLLNTPTVDQVYNGTSANAQSGIAVKSAIDNAISAVYKPAGSKSAVSQLPDLSTEGANVLGNVYNMTAEFTTTADFVEGADKKYPAGTNVVVVNTSATDTPVYKFDVLAGFIDLTPYALVNSLANIATTGEYSDLINAPVLANVATSGDYADLTNTPAFANIALSGEYSDLINAPTLATVATTGEYSDLLNTPTVDQTYNATSANAQSGVAVASAISDMQVVSNMVDTISNTSTNTTYPTASAVYNTTANLSGVVFRDWSSS